MGGRAGCRPCSYFPHGRVVSLGTNNSRATVPLYFEAGNLFDITAKSRGKDGARCSVGWLRVQLQLLGGGGVLTFPCSRRQVGRRNGAGLSVLVAE